MTLDDFKTQAKLYKRFQFQCGLLFFGLFFAAGIATLFVAKRIDKTGFDKVGVITLAVSYR